MAALVGVVCTTPLAIAAAMFPLAVVAFAVRAVSLGLFMAAVTPLIVLLVESGLPGTSEWAIAAARAGFTTLGGAIAVAANFALWPSWEPQRLAQEARVAIGAHGAYADAVLAFLAGEAQVGAVDRARRAAGMASNNLEASISRALTEPGTTGRDRLEAALVIDAALRRIAGRLSAMQLDPGQLDPGQFSPGQLAPGQLSTAESAAGQLTAGRLDPGLYAARSPDALAAWHDWIGGAMRALAAGQTALQPRPVVIEADSPVRIARQIELMAGAMERLS